MLFLKAKLSIFACGLIYVDENYLKKIDGDMGNVIDDDGIVNLKIICQLIKR